MHTMHAHTHNTLTFPRCKFSWYLDRPIQYFYCFLLFGEVKKKLSCAQGVSHVTVTLVLASWDSQSASCLTNHVK